MEKRLDYIDKLRGFAILMVVMGHLYLPYTKDGSSHPVAEMIYSFHMPLFFFISGYLCEITHKIDRIGYWQFCIKKATSLLIPYFTWVVAKSFIFTDKPVASFREFISLFDFFPNKLFWFMPVLFLIMLLYAFQHKLIHKTNLFLSRSLFTGAACCFLCASGVLLHEYFLLIYAIYVFCFLAGAFLMKEPRIQESIKSDMCFGGGSVVLCILWMLYPFDARGRALFSFFNVVLMFSCSVCSIIVLYNFFVKASLPKSISWFFSEMGKMSVVIYLTPLIMLPKGFVFEGITATTESLVILLIAIVQCLMAYAIGKFVYTIPFLRLIMYGKR